MLKNVLQFSNRDTIEEEAASWLVRLDGGPMGADEMEEFRAWLNRDPRHRKTLEKQVRVWGDLDSLGMLADVFPLKTAARTPANRFRTNLPWAATAMIFCLLLVGLLVYPGQNLPLFAGKSSEEHFYETALGQQSTVNLADGSVMVLNTNTRVEVQFDTRRRGIRLLAGEAHFEVAKHSDWPFMVYAGNGYVKAVGTAFSVRLTGKEVGITVSEGTVQVVADAASLGADDQSARAGQTLVLSERGVARYGTRIEQVEYLPEPVLQQREAWKSGRWVFEGDRLADVIEEAQRYTDRQLRIVDPVLAELKVGGSFRAGDVNSLLSALERGFDVQVTAVGEQLQLSLADNGPKAH